MCCIFQRRWSLGAQLIGAAVDPEAGSVIPPPGTVAGGRVVRLLFFSFLLKNYYILICLFCVYVHVCMWEHTHATV